MIEIDPATRSGFAATITAAGGVVGSDSIVCTVTGYSGVGTTRSVKTVQLHFIRTEFNGSVLNSAVATRGRFTMLKGAVSGVPGVSSDSIANVTSAAGTSPAVAMSGGAIGGKIGLAGGGSAAISGGSVSGTSNLTTIHQEHVKPAGPPGFPYVDTSIFAPYAVNTFTTTSSVVKNVRIPAGTNPRFTADVTIQGLCTSNPPTPSSSAATPVWKDSSSCEQAGDSTVNKIDGRGNFTYGNLPLGSQFDPLRDISGIAMLAPTASLTISGSVDSRVRGNLILGSFNNAGSADLRLDKGSIVTMDNTATSAVFNGKAVKFSETGLGNPPSAGVLFGSRFLPEDGTYAEGN